MSEQTIGTTITNQHGEVITRRDDRTFRVFDVDGVRRVGSRPIYATLAESLTFNARDEINRISPTLTQAQKLNLMAQALDAAAAVISASDYDDHDNPVYRMQQAVLGLRENVRQENR